jgi:hypothetical protein
MANGFLGNFNPDALLAISTGLLTGSNPQEQLGNAAMGFAQVRKDQRQRNATVDWLQKNSPDLLPLLDAGMSPGELLTAAYKQKQDQLKAQAPSRKFQTLPNGEYGYFDENAGAWTPLGSAPKAGSDGGPEYGLNPQYGVDAEGNPVLIQLGKDGTSRRTPLPEGVTLSKEPIKLDAGDHYILLNPITQQPVGRVEKNLAEAERQKEIGTSQGKSEASAAGDLQAGLDAKKLIESIKTDPNRGWGTGKTSIFNSMPGTGGYDFQRKVDQAKSGAFLTAIQKMRGLGALSNTEGQVATDAVTRMNTSMTEEGFLEALADYERIVDQGIANAQAKMGLSGGATPTQGRRLRFNPNTGELE